MSAQLVATVGRIEVPPAVLRHRFYLEALACTGIRDVEDLERVVGTENTKRPELYGWAANVDPHVDDSGFMYFVPLSLQKSFLCVQDACGQVGRPSPIAEDCDVLEHPLAVGEVVRLFDFAVHWTADLSSVVAGFVGSFDEPCDAEAVAMLQEAVHALARGDYYGAPRVRPGFKAIMPDECLATFDYAGHETMLLKDARARGAHVIQCCSCSQPAVRLDSHWPYFWDNNRCRAHLKGADHG